MTIELVIEFQIWRREIETMCDISHYSVEKLYEIWSYGIDPEQFYYQEFLPF